MAPVSTDFPRRLIATNQLVGAALVLLTEFSSHEQFPGRLPIAYILSALWTAGVSAYAGFELFRDSHRGFTMSLWVQGLQILNFAGPSFDVRLELGIKATVEITTSVFMTHWGYGGLFGFWPWSGAPQFTVVVNGLALLAFAWLWRHRTTVRRRNLGWRRWSRRDV